MKTRSQRRKEDECTATDKSSSRSKSKKTKLSQKLSQKDPKATGKAEGSKKLKKTDDPPPMETRREKAKAKRVKEDSPEKEVVKEKKKSQSKEKAKDVKRTSSKRKPSIDKQEEKPKPRKSIAKKASPEKQSAKEMGDSEKENIPQDGHIKKVQFKGKVPIDDYFPLSKANFHVLEYAGKVYSTTLNQTSIQNNNNKYYILQILQSDSNSNHCYFYTRWGRVGVKGQQSNLGPHTITNAISLYNSKYHDKYHNGDYREIELNYGDPEDKKDSTTKRPEEKDKDEEFNKSKLPNPVKRLIQLIFDLKMMNKQMIEIGYNVNKMPLGNLSKDSILRGYKILQELMEEIKGKSRVEIVNQLTNDFYSYIPHDFGFTHMSNFILNDQVKIKKKLEMLESLAEIKLATSIISSSSEDENQIDSNYLRLNRQIRPVDKSSQEFDIINRYLQSTHGTTHTSYTLDLQDLFTLNNEAENVRFTKDIDNKMLLWHGSRLTNFVGILSQGLRIAPPEAPVTGYMFGKGVYFADMSSKSANYCFTSRENSTGILLLCEVALGDMNEKYQADPYASFLPPGKKSTKGVGRTAPNPANFVKMDDVTIPMGPGEHTQKVGCSLLYNEFIVYDIAQIKIRYLLRTKFNYRSPF